MLVLLALLACSGGGTCRGDDADCDGVPDLADHCPGSDPNALHDPAGCTEDQSAGCKVELLAPADRAAVVGETRFAWNGTCEEYLLQFSNDPAFPAGASRTDVRTEATEVVAGGRERYWRVVGGLHGSSTGFTAGPRELGRDTTSADEP